MADPPCDGFRLTKWYLDCAEAGGRVAIAYWASLAWRSLSLTWSSVAVYGADAPVRRRSGLGRAAEPRLDGRRLTWCDPTLDVAVAAEVLQEGTTLHLLEAAPGRVDWTCVAPAADVCVHAWGGPSVRGRGYVERLELTLPPWRLPLRELRWGRWIGAEAPRSVVWIDWRGESPATWVLRDGAACACAAVSDAGIGAGGAVVPLNERRLLHSRRLDDVLGGIAPLRRLLPPGLLAAEDTRWVCYGPMLSSTGELVPGSAIAEVVRFA